MKKMDTIESILSNVDVKAIVRSFVETTSAALAVTGAKGVILWCNERVSEIYEEPRENILGTHLGDRIVYPEGIDVEQWIQQAIEKGYSTILKTQWITRTGKRKFMHQRVYRLDDAKGDHIGFWGIGYELTEEKRSINDSKAAVRVLTELQKEEVRATQLDIIDMLKMQSDALCPGQELRVGYCPAIHAVEEFIIKDRPRLNRILTTTEARVAEYTKQGLSIKRIADRMNISERTVKNHRHAIRKKLNISLTSINLTKYLQNFPR